MADKNPSEEKIERKEVTPEKNTPQNKEVLSQKLDTLLSNTIPEKKEESKALIQEITSITIKQKHKQRIFSGPLPHPNALKKYENIMPGASERIFSLAEDEAIHRRSLEKKDQDHLIKMDHKKMKQSERGQLFAFILTVLVLVASIILGYLGMQTVSTILVSSTLLAIFSAFILSKKGDKSPQSR